jgi:transposase
VRGRWWVRVVGQGVKPVRKGYPSDLSDAQWSLIEPLLPPPPRLGRREKHPRRQIVNAILYLDRSGCSWRQLPSDFPPWQTVYWYFVRWEEQGVTERIIDALRQRLRTAEGRQPAPSAGVIDSQSVKAADTVGADTRGWDAGKKVNGRKRFIVTDTMGLLLVVMACSAGVQDRQGARTLLLRLYHRVPTVRFCWADGGFSGQLVDWAKRIVRTTVVIVRKTDDQRGFVVLPRRWVVERTFAWITAHRRLARDYERHPYTSEALIRWAMINVMSRRLARKHPSTRPGPRPLEPA